MACFKRFSVSKKVVAAEVWNGIFENNSSVVNRLMWPFIKL